MNLSLTDEQYEIFKQNFGLVVDIAKKYNLKDNKDDIEDMIQIASIGMIKAIKTYRNKAKLSTYATKIMNNEIRTYLKSKSYDASNNISLTIADITDINYENLINSTIDLQNNFNTILNYYKNEKYKILNEYFEHPESTQIKIANKLGYSFGYVNRTINNFRKTLKEKLKESY